MTHSATLTVMDVFASSIPSLQQCDVGQPLTCLSFSPHLQQAAVGGRDIRLFTVTPTHLTLQHRAVSSSGSLGQSTSVSDLSFHPSSHPSLSSSLLAASTSGHISLYSLASSTGLRRPLRLFDQHTRTVNRVAWHTLQADVFYSASQDGSVLWWDVRVSGCVGGWDAEAGAVRDVQMDKGAAGAPLVAAGYEDGSVAVWDTRGGSGGGALKDQLLTISAHQGYTLTLDWHPTNHSLLATGGKDRNVCVWDVSTATAAEHANSTTPLHIIATSASVHRLAWRPHRPYQLASSASSSVDFDVQLWNIHTPHIPLAIVSHHRTVVSGIAFKQSGDELLTATRGGVVSQLRVAESYAPYERLTTVAVDWSVRDELVSVEDAMSRERSVIDVRDAPPVFAMQYQWREKEADSRRISERPGLLHVRGLAGVVEGGSGGGDAMKGSSRLSDVEVIEYCARRYRLEGDCVQRLCAHNATVALSVRRPQLAHIWDVLALLYADNENDNKKDDATDSDQDGFRAHAVHPNKLTLAPFSSTPPSLPSSRAASRSSVRTATPRMSAVATPVSPLTDQATTAQFLAYLPVSTTSSSHNTSASSLHHTVLQASATRSTGQLSRHAILLDTLPVIHLSHVYHSHKQPKQLAQPPTDAKAAVANQPNITRASPASSNRPSSPHPASPAPTVPRMISQLEQPSHLSALLLTLLDQLINAGDAQTCCSIVAVLSRSAHSQPILASLPVERLRTFFFHYIDQLHRLRLFSEATAVHQLTPPHLLSPSNQHNTNVALMCGECRRGCEASDKGCYCGQCRSGMSVCSVCELLVRGLYVWCQGCGHGGHASHMEEWFSTSRVCPTGCMHRCVDELVVSS